MDHYSASSRRWPRNPQAEGRRARRSRTASWGRIVEVMDTVKAANVKNISAFTKEAGKP